MRRLLIRRLAALAVGFLGATVAAQPVKLPPPSRTVYKCTVEGKTVYSDNPCIGAQRMEIEPTRGMNSMTGKPQTGADVRREQQRETFAEAVKPITGKEAKALEKDRHRFQLPHAAKRECARLDGELLYLEQAEREAQPRDLPQAQQTLFTSRKRYRELGC